MVEFFLMIIISTLYIVLAGMIWAVESMRIKRSGPDLLTLFILMLFVQVILPSIFLLSIKGLYGVPETDVPFFNEVLNSVGFYEASVVFFLSFLFVVSLYASWFIINQAIKLQKNYVPTMQVFLSRRRWFFVMLIGLLGFFVLVKELGGYNNLVLFRTNPENLNKNFVTSNLFSLSTTFLLLSAAGIVMFWENKKRIMFTFSLICAISFSLMTVSRRAFLIIFLLVYFAFIIERKRLFFNKTVVLLLVMFVPVLLYGKHFLFLLAHDITITFSAVTAGKMSLLGAVTKIAANVGITDIESWATLLTLHIPMRFGTDHLLSILRRIPDGILGLGITFPERMVRISTQVFVGADRQDIPPGFIGQMWLDFRIFGPVFWGMGFALIIAFVQLFYNQIVKSRDGIFFFVLIGYIISLPVNSGTFDFVFSVHVFFLFIFMGFMTKIKYWRYTD